MNHNQNTHEATWEVRDGGFRHCSYCGSLHPADAIKTLQTPGTRCSGSDWKYGWPHKFYIQPPNPNADELVEVGGESGPEVDGSHPDDVWVCFAHHRSACTCPREPATGYYSRPTLGKRSHLWCKFYNIHLKDASDEEFAAFAELSSGLFGIVWSKDEKGIKFSAPPGYQQAGDVLEDGRILRTL